MRSVFSCCIYYKISGKVRGAKRCCVKGRQAGDQEVRGEVRGARSSVFGEPAPLQRAAWAAPQAPHGDPTAELNPFLHPSGLEQLLILNHRPSVEMRACQALILMLLSSSLQAMF